MALLADMAVAGKVATLTLRREEARNALSLELLEAVRKGLDGVPAGDVTVLVITGAGRAFCAGMDLRAVLDDPPGAARLLHLLADVTLKIRSLACVTLAVVNGAAIGGGCGLACACDVAMTHADSKMGFPEVDLGVCPAVVSPWLIRKIGAGRARRVLLSGGLMSGTEAHALGIVDHCVPTLGDLAPRAVEVAERLSAGGPGALRATKHLLNQLDGSLDADVLRRAADLSAMVLGTPETQRILRARTSKEKGG